MSETETELQVLQDIRHQIQAGFLALLVVAQHAANKNADDIPSGSMYEHSAEILRNASAILKKQGA